MPSNTPKASKAERRDAAREQARVLREQQAKRDKRNKILGIGGLSAAVVALVVVVVYVVTQGTSTSALPDYEDLPLSEVTSVPTVAMEDGGIPTSAEGVGVGDDSVTQIDVYLDYMCPACGAFESSNGENLIQLAESGKATVVYHPIAILNRFSNGTGFSTRAAAAAALVAQDSPAAFSTFNQQMFAGQPDEGTSGLTDAEIADIARDSGVDDDVADRIADGGALESFGQWVHSATNAASANADLVNPTSGNFGTPTIAIDGVVWTENWSDPSALLSAIN
ncbi:DsbA family protein [Cellulomonas triticagri]|uniref:Disulfide bond formation protein DsbA n=1 Tax=Cellulomonas triticagri TaxID=2483352 RepID=A0A3M2J449_9CELL|nr:thioredoxin domain-containing protein [Cellulomonas triticagri]RMI06861.1 disulfide bond formation protein DsbA [Cellulomonas triticagri]